jgi:hypothetical protein
MEEQEAGETQQSESAKKYTYPLIRVNFEFPMLR